MKLISLAYNNSSFNKIDISNKTMHHTKLISIADNVVFNKIKAVFYPNSQTHHT